MKTVCLTIIAILLQSLSVSVQSQQAKIIDLYERIFTDSFPVGEYNATFDIPRNYQLSFPIARKPSSIIEREVPADGHGQMAITNYRVLKEFKDNNGNKYSLVRCVLETGRTHQIRVHFSHIGHPLLGDSLYGNASVLVPGQALCCTKLSFFHPISNEEICFEIPFPVSYILHFT